MGRWRRFAIWLSALLIGALVLGGLRGGGEERAALAATRSYSAEARQIAARLRPTQLIGQRFIYTLDGPTLPDSLGRRLERGRAAGVVLFARSIGSAAALRDLTAAIQRHAAAGPGGLPALIMVDQEGGPVRRLSGPPESSAATMGATLNGHEIRRQGRATGRLLANYEINVDLAPVTDIGIPGRALYDEHRTFATTSRAVGRDADHFRAGLASTGTAATAKHFPGFGRAEANTDNTAVTINRSDAEARIDLRPFANLIDNGIELVMLSTAIYPQLSSAPAALARPVAGRLLRRNLDFKGVSVSDALDTPALDAYGSSERVAIDALRAGTDLLLYASSFDAARRADEAARTALQNDRLDEAALRRSAKRVLALRLALAD